MKAEFIYQPISGLYPEKHFGGITPNCLWIKFEDSNDQEWVASFEKSWLENKKFIINFANEPKAFIVADGQTYLINIDTREKVNIKEFSSTRYAIMDPEGKNIYFSEGYDLRFINSEGKDFVLFKENYFDEIKSLKIMDNKLEVIYWNYQTNDELFRLEIDLISKEVKDSFESFKKPNLINKLQKWMTKW